MPSFSHDGLVRLFQDRPELAVELLRDVLGIEVPAYTETRIASIDATDIEPASRYADLVVLLVDDSPVLGLVVEVQLDVDDDKLVRWPAYLTNLRSRLRCQVELLVVTPSRRVARWAAQPIPVGRGAIHPVVLGPDGVPLVADHGAARRDPEMAVLSALAHGRGEIEAAVTVAAAALAAVAAYPTTARCYAPTW